MKKVIFKGTINGKEFNDVKSYNEEINKLTKEGAEIQASTSTKIVDTNESEECECDKKCTCEHCKCHKLEDLMLPGFDRENYHYIDSIVSDDDKVFDEKMKSKSEYLNKMFNRIVDHMHSDQYTYDRYVQAIQELLQGLELDAVKTDNAVEKVDTEIKSLENEMDKLAKEIDGISKQLEDLYDQQDVLSKALEVIDMYGDFYEQLTDEFDEKDQPSYPEPGIPETEMKEKEAQKESKEFEIPESNKPGIIKLTPEQEAALKNIFFNLLF